MKAPREWTRYWRRPHTVVACVAAPIMGAICGVMLWHLSRHQWWYAASDAVWGSLAALSLWHILMTSIEMQKLNEEKRAHVTKNACSAIDQLHKSE